MKLVGFLKEKWWLIALIFIFLFSYYIRSLNIVEDRILSFDPTFQYRFTKYFVDWNHIPVWDELSYYVGRETTVSNYPPFMWYLTSIIYSILSQFGLSLMTVASYASALYGAMIVIPAFFLGKELSNEYGGLMSATLFATAPQILIRTFGSSYDSDQMVLFFMILTLYLGLRALRKRTVSSICIAITGFTAYMLTWWMFLYPFVIIGASVVFYLILSFLLNKKWFSGKLKFMLPDKIEFSLKEGLTQIKILITVFIGLFFTNLIVMNFNLRNTVFEALNALVGFAGRAEAWIVNISIAELQPFNIFDLGGWILAMGRFVTGLDIIDNIIFFSFIFALIFGVIKSFKKNLFLTSFIITLLGIAVITTTRGIRFTEFSSAFFIVLVSVGFGSLIEWSKKDKLLKTSSVGLCLLIVVVAILLGYQLGKGLGPDINPNWDNGWDFLKTQTPELSLVGTWWDPGHMVTGLAERRVIGDGAHCAWDCLYTINDRITDLGKIMATDDENESINLIRKYQGTSPKVYWIASDDLIGKFQWIQYFGEGCDARYEQRCPLYMQMGQESVSTDAQGNIILRKYSDIYVFLGNIPIPIYVQGINGALFDEIIYYEAGQPKVLKIGEQDKVDLINALEPLERQLNFRFTNRTIELTVWIPQHYSYIVLIPRNQRDNVFTKMFFLEGQGLEHFKQVFRNEQFKLYEVI